MVPRWSPRSSLAHADAVVRDGQRTGVLVGMMRMRERVALAHQFGPCQRPEAQLVERVGGVRHQLAKEHLLVAVQRIDDEAQHLAHFGLESMFGRFGHGGARFSHPLPASRGGGILGRDAPVFPACSAAARCLRGQPGGDDEGEARAGPRPRGGRVHPRRRGARDDPSRGEHGECAQTGAVLRFPAGRGLRAGRDNGG